MMPSRLMIRHWLAHNTRDQILQELEKIKAEHGPDAEQDVRDILNYEREQFANGAILESPAEASLLSEHEQWKRQVQADIEFQKKLHRDSES